MNITISIGSKKYAFRIEIILLILVVFWLLWGHLLCSCSKISISEGFQMVNSFINRKIEGFSSNNVAYSSQFANFQDPTKINTKKWFLPDLVYAPGQRPSQAAKAIYDRPAQPIPLPQGELDFFATTPFKPECCPNTFSSSQGCACMTVKQVKYLNDRGGNNVPFSEY
jgi:hypothetical protein